jgi:hypothetical protein
MSNNLFRVQTDTHETLQIHIVACVKGIFRGRPRDRDKEVWGPVAKASQACHPNSPSHLETDHLSSLAKARTAVGPVAPFL